MWHLVFQISPIIRVFEVDIYNFLRILGLKWIIVVRLFLFRWNSMMTTIGYSSLRDGEEAKRNILPAESSFWAWCDDTMSVNLNDLVPFWDNIQPPIQSNLWDFYLSFIIFDGGGGGEMKAGDMLVTGFVDIGWSGYCKEWRCVFSFKIFELMHKKLTGNLNILTKANLIKAWDTFSQKCNKYKSEKMFKSSFRMRMRMTGLIILEKIVWCLLEHWHHINWLLNLKELSGGTRNWSLNFLVLKRMLMRWLEVMIQSAHEHWSFRHF